MSVEVDAARALIEASDSGLRLERGTVVDQDAPSPAHAMVRLADGLVVPVLGACALGADVTLIVGGGVVTLGPCPRVGVSAVRTSGQSTSNAAQANLSWPTVSATHAAYLAAGGSAVTIPAGLGGMYTVTVAANASTGLGARAYLSLILGGSMTRTYRCPLYGGGEDRLSVTAALPLLDGDTVTAAVYQSTGTVTWTAYLDLWRVGW